MIDEDLAGLAMHDDTPLAEKLSIAAAEVVDAAINDRMDDIDGITVSGPMTAARIEIDRLTAKVASLTETGGAAATLLAAIGHESNCHTKTHPDDPFEGCNCVIGDVERGCMGDVVAWALREAKRLTMQRDAAVQAFDDLIAFVWRAATGDTHEGPESVKALLAAVETTRRERDETRAIIEGRETAPSDEEIAAHHSAGGWWLVTAKAARTIAVAPFIVRFVVDEDDVPMIEIDSYWEPRNIGLARLSPGRWIALDADSRLCPWPVVGGAR